MSIGILGVGAYVPTNVVTNSMVSAWTGVPPGWIEERTGIHERRYADPDTPTSELAQLAVDDLVRTHPDALDDLAAIIVATSTPDQPQPTTAVILQNRLGLRGVPAVDLNAVCSGALYALDFGAAFAAKHQGAKVLVVAADKYSTIMDRTDWRTVSLFGDGAGAILLGPAPAGYGLLAGALGAHGEFRDYVEVKGGGTQAPLDADGIAAGQHLFRMKGRKVRGYALTALPETIDAVLRRAGLALTDVDRFVCHQANPRLLGELAKQLGADFTKFPLTAPWCGNSGAASALVTLAHSHAERPIEEGENLLLAAIGGGMTYAVEVVRATSALSTFHRPLDNHRS